MFCDQVHAVCKENECSVGFCAVHKTRWKLVIEACDWEWGARMGACDWCKDMARQELLLYDYIR